MYMKKVSLFLVTILIFVFSFSNNAYSWRSSGHENRIRTVFNKALPDTGKEGFSKGEQDLLVCSTVIVDSQGYGKGVKCLHGRYNYILTVEYLTELACSYRKSNSSIANDKSYIKKFYDNFQKNHVLSGKHKTDIELANECIVNLLKKENVCKTVSNETSVRKKSIKILGIACHVIGDTFAHETVVPVDAVKTSYGKGKTNTTFDTTVFKKEKDWNAFVKYFKNNKMLFRQLDDTDSTTIKNGYVYGQYFSSIIYEDSPEFWEERYNATYTVTKRLLVSYNEILKNKAKVYKYNKDLFNYYGTYTSDKYQLNEYNQYRNELNN